jgi:hypothetical protein
MDRERDTGILYEFVGFGNLGSNDVRLGDGSISRNITSDEQHGLCHYKRSKIPRVSLLNSLVS